MHLISSGDWPGDSTFSPDNGFEMIMENNGIEWLIATGRKGIRFEEYLYSHSR